MIESGSHQPADVAAWRLPEGTALRIELPDPALQPFFEQYAVLDSDVAIYRGGDSWVLPGPPMIWIALTTPELSMSPRRRRATEVVAAMLMGPTSITVPVQAHGGISIVIPLTPRGWARLFAAPAADLRDQIVPLDAHRPAAWTAKLMKQLQACVKGPEVKELLDTFFADHLPPAGKKEEAIGRIEQVLAEDDGRSDVSTWYEKIGFGSARTLARACERNRGFGPKVLQRRQRFLRSFVPMLIADGPVDFSRVPPGYHDVPHFLRDARHFLGMTAKQFTDMPMVYLRSILRAQAQIIGPGWPRSDTPTIAL